MTGQFEAAVEIDRRAAIAGYALSAARKFGGRLKKAVEAP